MLGQEPLSSAWISCIASPSPAMPIRPLPKCKFPGAAINQIEEKITKQNTTRRFALKVTKNSWCGPTPQMVHLINTCYKLKHLPNVTCHEREHFFGNKISTCRTILISSFRPLQTTHDNNTWKNCTPTSL